MGGAFASAATAPREFFPGHEPSPASSRLSPTNGRRPHSRRRFRSDGFERGSPENLAEILSEDGQAEVGYLDGGARVVEGCRSRAGGTGLEPFEIAPGAPILITGGARGITAVVAADLARRWRPTLLLIGTSPLPADEEDPATRGLTDPATLKSALWQRLSRSSGSVGPADVERAYQALRREREIRDNGRALRTAGATVEYARADVRDAAAVERQLNDWRTRFGPIAGLIHGAAVIRDKLLRDKTPDSFDQVVGTKLKGARSWPICSTIASPPHSSIGRDATATRVRPPPRMRPQQARDLARQTMAGTRCLARLGTLVGSGHGVRPQTHLGRGLGAIPRSGRARTRERAPARLQTRREVIVAGDLGPLENFVERAEEKNINHGKDKGKLIHK